ncbi:MAG: ABC transporter permease [Betaproteobacteria bacterium]
MSKLNRSNLWFRFGTLGLFAAVFIFFASLSPVFLLPSNLLNVVKQATILAIISMGMTTVIVVTNGESDMSVGGVTGFSAAATVTLLVAGFSPWVAALAGLSGGILLGLLNGLLVTKIGLLPFLATLATMNLGMGLEQLITKGLHVPFSGSVIGQIANDNWHGLPLALFVLVPVFLAFYVMLDHTPLGRKIYAIGGNLQAARASGINVTKYTIIAFALSGLTCGIAGVLLVGRLSGLTPLAAAPLLLDVLLAGYISSTMSSVGAPNVGGALVGALLVGVLSNGLAVIRVPTFYMNLVKGFLILVVVAVNVAQRRRTVTG